MLDYFTLAEFNQRSIEAMDEENKKREDSNKYPGISKQVPLDEIKARLEERKRQQQGEF